MGEGSAAVLQPVAEFEKARKAKDAAFSAAEQIVVGYDLVSLRTRLEAWPEKLLAKRQQVRDLGRRLKATQEDLESIEAGLQAQIAVEVDDKTGKARFSNDTARKAELLIRKRNHPDYKVLAEEADRLQLELDNAELELRMLEDQWTAMLAANESASAEIRLLAR